MKARVKIRSFLLLLGLCVGVFPGFAEARQAPETDRAEEVVSPDLEGRIQEISRLVAQRAQADSSVLLTRDIALDRAARFAANLALRGPVDRSQLRSEIWAQGVRDFDFLPMSVVIRGLTPSDALSSLLDEAKPSWVRLNTFGVGLAEQDDRLAVTILLSRRAAVFSPGAGNRESLLIGAGYVRPRLYVTRPDGDVDERPARVEGSGRWSVNTAPGNADGTWLLELVADGERGPEVLALWPVGQRSSDRRPSAADPAAAWVVGARSGPNRSPTRADVEAAEDHLWGLINRTRSSRSLVPLRRLPELTRAARTHAGDIGRGEAFGHQTSSGSVKERVEKEGLAVLRVTENAAVAANVAEVHAALMGSPAHRKNLLDSEVSAGGVGVVLKRDRRGRWSAVVSEVFASVMAEGEGGRWDAALLNRLNDRRMGLGYEPLRRRERLDEVAREACVEVMARGSTQFTSDQRRTIAERARFHFLNVRTVGVDLLITTDLEAALRLPHAIDPSFSEIGIAIERLEAPLGEHPKGALVITLLFTQR